MSDTTRTSDPQPAAAPTSSAVASRERAEPLVKTTLSDAADERAHELEQQMTDDERFSLVISLMGYIPGSAVGPRDPRLPEILPNMSAGYTPGIARLGIPPIQSSDASMGVTNPGYRPDDPGATAFPSLIALGSSFNAELVREGGAAIAKEARSRGLNVQLAGGCNLVRDPRNGRNFEYFSEDPWLSAVLAAAQVEGIQSEGVVSTLKHFTLNCNETNRHWLDAVIDPDAHRESDLLTFQVAIERAQPGSIMTGYNKINGAAAGGNDVLLNGVLKGAWGYKGYVMSDWGATPEWGFALKGLDQESGIQADRLLWGREPFTDDLREAYARGELPKERLSDMVRRILRSIIAVGADRWGSAPAVDMAAHERIALEGARQGIVLLDNDGVLPIPSDKPMKIAVIGGYAQLGVVSGTGSGAVAPIGGFAATVRIGGAGVMGKHRNLFLFPPSPMEALKAAFPQAEIEFDPGYTPAEATLTAKRCDLAIVFGIRVEGEGFDMPDLSLPWGQDAVIDAVAAANPNTVVVLQTGNPVTMPWRGKVRAIMQAWYPGQSGAQAIADVLAGRVNPSGRTPVTWPASLADTPRPELACIGAPWATPVTIGYQEGAEVGYRWHAKQDRPPLYAFGHGLSFTDFAYGDFEAEGGETVTASFTVTNIGDRAGTDVPQVYLTSAPGERRMRLLGFERIELAPGESRRVSITADPRLLARFDGQKQQWRIDEGDHAIVLSRAADAPVTGSSVRLDGRFFGA